MMIINLAGKSQNPFTASFCTHKMDIESKKSAWINPLPIIMVLLLAGGVLVKNIPLESSRPAATERVKFVPTGLQNVEARLWQDPFAAVEAHESRAERSLATEKRGLSAHDALRNRLDLLRTLPGEVTILAVSVFGDSFAESAESRRRARYAVISALGFHGFYPETSNAIGYLRLPLRNQSNQNLTQEIPGHAESNPAIPFEWFNQKKSTSKVLLLWLNESLYDPDLIFNRLPDSFGELTLIGPAGSAMLLELVGYSQKSNQVASERVRIFSPTATIDNCTLLTASGQGMSADTAHTPWRCFFEKNASLGQVLRDKKIVRTIGTDDVLSISLLWELWHRGVNRDQRWTLTGQHPESCNDGLVLISEWDSAYSRALAGNLTESFSALCQTQDNQSPPIRHFTYLRGIDGVVPGMESKSPSKTPRQSNEIQAHDLRSQLDSAAPELAEGLSQYDYLRRLVDEIAELDQDPQFAKHGVRAIGITGSDVYDKLLILQALRSRFKGKIFFTTDLDARFLHADQKNWTRNLVIASNFNLTLHPLLQRSSLPFRDGYQTSTYLATLMALTSRPIDHWEKALHGWLRPGIYEIGRTMAVPIASPSVDDLIGWISGSEPQGISQVIKPQPCEDWTSCERIEPHTALLGTSSLQHWHLLAFGFLIILWITISSQHAKKWIKAAATCSTPSTPSAGPSEISVVSFWSLVLIIMTILTTVIVGFVSASSLEQGIGEPVVWLEGISVWPNLTIRFMGFVTTLGLILAFIVNIRRQIDWITDRFCLAIPSTWSLSRSQFSAIWNGPNLDLTRYDAHGNPIHPTSEIEVATLWKNYLRATSWHEKGGWIFASAMIVFMLSMILFTLFDMPAFPYRGELTRYLNYILLGLITPLLWLIILWIGYEHRACAQFVESLGKTGRIWPDALLDREENETGVTRTGLDPYLCFHLVIAVTQRIQTLIYLPFILLFFIVIARSDMFGALDFPLPLVIIVITALFYTLFTARIVRKRAEDVRTQLLTQYDLMLLQHAQPGAQSNLSADQINRLANLIRTTHAGAYSFFLQRPTLLALLLPFGGFGGTQLIEYLFTILS